jgi:streptogramin lyase
VYLLSNILAACVNTIGGSSGDGSNCGTLFKNATPTNGTAPQDTVTATLNIAKNPSANVAALYALAPSGAAFPTLLTQQPVDWTLAISYPGFSSPKGLAVDSSGNVWVANSGTNTVKVIPQSGASAIASYSGNGLNSPSAIAIDSSGNAWVANHGANTLSAFTTSGGAFGSSPFSPTGVATPTALAIDASGIIWVTSPTTLVGVSSSGTATYTASTGISTPTAVAINPY